MSETEVDVLRKLLADGFMPGMRIRTLTETEIQERLPRGYWAHTVKALPLARADGERRMFFYMTPEADTLAQQLVEEQRRITGFTVCVYCSAIGLDAVHGRTVDLTAAMRWLRAIRAWDVRKSTVSNVFEIHFHVEGDDRAAVERHVSDVEAMALALSVKNRLGFHVEEYSCHPVFVGQPLSVVVGLEERASEGLTLRELDEFAALTLEPLALQAARALRGIYSQVSPRLQLIIGWAALEDIFKDATKSSAEHLLKPAELDELVELLAKHSKLSTDANARKRVEGIVRNPALISRQNRNERLANAVAKVTCDDRDRVYERIRDASQCRGKLAHGDVQAEDVKVHVEFLESIFLKVFRGVKA